MIYLQPAYSLYFLGDFMQFVYKYPQALFRNGEINFQT